MQNLLGSALCRNRRNELVLEPGQEIGFAGELHAGVDRPDVGLVEEGRVRQTQDEALQVWRRTLRLTAEGIPSTLAVTP